MPSNPFGNPLLVPIVLRLGALILLASAAILIAERHRLSRIGESVLFRRLRTWLVIGPVFVVSLFSEGFVVFLLALAIGVQGLREYSRLTTLERRYQALLQVWLVVGLLIAAFGRRYFLFLPIGFFAVLTLVPVVTGRVGGSHRQVTSALFGYLYIGLPMAYLVMIKAQEQWGLEFLLIVGVAVALSDVAAFTFGSLLKGPKIAPAVSPGKTWSGAAGNLFGAALGVWLTSVAIPASWSGLGVVVLTVSVGVGALWGDLAESFIKRDFAVKDTGESLPGFGGVLDRVDSLLLTMPLSYYALLVANRIAAAS